jgi:AcrR family transcriptional regulator
MVGQPVFVTSGPLPRGPHGLRPDEVAASQRLRLMAAVTDLVAEHGLAGTTVTELLRTAGVSRATFYALYTDKQACLLAAYDYFIETLLERTALRVAPAGDWQDFVDSVLEGYLGTLEADRGAARAMVVEMEGAGPEARERMRAAYRAVADLLRARYESLRREDPALAPIPDRLFLGFVLGVRDLVRDAIETRPDEPLTDLAPDIRFWLRATLAGAAQAAA